MREWHSQSHVPMVLQISGRVGAKVSETLGLRLDSVWDWEHHPRDVSAARRGIVGGSCVAGPCVDDHREHGI